MFEGEAETGAEVLEEGAVVLIFMFGFVVVPVDGDGLVDEIGVGLQEPMGPEYLEQDDSDIGPIVDDILVDLSERHADAFEVEDHDCDRDDR